MVLPGHNFIRHMLRFVLKVILKQVETVWVFTYTMHVKYTQCFIYVLYH